MHFSIFNSNTGETFDMKFESHEQKREWLSMAKGFQCLGEVPGGYLPTRHAVSYTHLTLPTNTTV